MEVLRLGKAGTQVPPELNELLDEILTQISPLFYRIIAIVTFVNKVTLTCTVLFHLPMKNPGLTIYKQTAKSKELHIYKA